MGLISIFWGIGALLWMLFALIPLLGWMNWLLIPFAAIGAIIGAVGMALSRPGMRSRATAGVLMNLVVIVVGITRLGIGGGIL